MPQAPHLVDAVQIEPGTVDAGGSRLIERDPTTGDLLFKSPLHPNGVTLSGLAGTSSVQNVLIVGKGGSGAEYTTIQSALDAVPTTSNSTSPTVILIYPGVYVEDVVLEKDGVSLIGVGRVQVENATTFGHTVTIRAGASTSPQWCWLENLRIRNMNPLRACVFVDGNSSLTLGTERVRLHNCEYVVDGLDGYQILASGAHIVEVFGGTCDDSIISSSIVVEQCNQFMIHDVRVLRGVTFSYDTALLTGATYSAYYTPPDAENHYKIARADDVGNVISNVIGAGGFTMAYCQRVGNLSVLGDQENLIVGSRVGTLAVSTPAVAKLVASTRGTASGTGTLSEEVTRGTAAFAAAASVAVVFDLDQPDTSFEVMLDSPTADRPWVTAKTVTGFTINFSAAQTTSVDWKVSRSVA